MSTFKTETLLQQKLFIDKKNIIMDSGRMGGYNPSIKEFWTKGLV